MAVHGYPRSTMDIDLWIMPEPDNAQSVLRALEDFGAPCNGLTPVDLQTEDTVFQIGVAPRRIDILTSIDGLKFEDAFPRSVIVEIDKIPVPVLSVPDLITNKRATGRLKDLSDAEALEQQFPKMSFE